MTQRLSNFLLHRFSEFMAAQMGVHFPQERWGDLKDVLDKCSKELGFENAEECIEHLPSGDLTRSQIEILASYLTVGETYFFRDSASFEVLEKHVLPELISKRRVTNKSLRIWSAGCCTGEEPYSLAMLITRLIPDFKDWSISILATDINPHFLHKATVGIYREWSFRETPEEIRKMFFREVKKGHFELSSTIRSLVTFSHLNLAEDIYPNIYSHTNGMDIIFCRNVVMYFKPERMQKVITSLVSSLVNNGWLFLSAVETITNKFPHLETVYFPKAILYRKTDKQPTDKDMTYSFADLSFDAFRPHQDDIPIPSSPEVQYKYTSLKKDDADRNKEVIMEMTRSCANEGQLTKAMEWCEKLIEIDKLNPSSWFLYATICEEQGNANQAITAFKRTLFLDHDYVPAHLSLGNFAKRQGHSEESERHFKAALSTLNKYPNEYLLPETEGMTAGHLKEIIQTAMGNVSKLDS